MVSSAVFTVIPYREKISLSISTRPDSIFCRISFLPIVIFQNRKVLDQTNEKYKQSGENKITAVQWNDTDERNFRKLGAKSLAIPIS